jgi:hypothetical protein
MTLALSNAAQLKPRIKETLKCFLLNRLPSKRKSDRQIKSVRSPSYLNRHEKSYPKEAIAAS